MCLISSLVKGNVRCNSIKIVDQYPRTEKKVKNPGECQRELKTKWVYLDVEVDFKLFTERGNRGALTNVIRKSIPNLHRLNLVSPLKCELQ